MNLVIIGNGFDRWAGLASSYEDFRKYYLANRTTQMKKLHISPYTITEGAKSWEVGPAEILYGDPFDPDELDIDFWTDFEESLGDIEAASLNLFFGKEKSDIRDLKRCARNSDRILRKAFCDWVRSIDIEAGKTGRFADDCVFINFNYTDTLTKNFGVPSCNDFHIHGEAKDPKSIIYGHTIHPQEPDSMLEQCNGRFQGLYAIEEILYKTDKHVQANIIYLMTFLLAQNIRAYDISNVYVLGHSMGSVDFEYFRFLTDALSGSNFKEEPDEEDLQALVNQVNTEDDFFLRLDYTVHRYGREPGNDEVSEEEEAAMQRYLKLQWLSNLQVLKRFAAGNKTIRKNAVGDMVSPFGQQKEYEPPMWHISCYSDADETRVDKVMHRLGYENYKTFGTIEECAGKVVEYGSA